MARSDRLLSALLLLRAHGRLTGRDLAQRLEVSERTVSRDMEALSAAGVPVFAHTGPPSVWALDEEWRTQLQVPGFEEVQLRALLMAETPTAGDGIPLRGTGSPSDMPQSDEPAETAQASLRERAASIRQRLYVDPTGWRDSSENFSLLPVVQDAVSRDRKLAISYRRGGRGELVERTVDPLGLVAKGSAWYLVARTPDGFRTYRVSRIECAKLLDQPSERPANFDLAAYWKSSMERFQDEVGRAMEAQRRAAQELEIAKQVQARLFPQKWPPLKTLDYAGVCIQARQVGGDYYDFLDLGRERLGLVVGDIAGKGIGAALLMANLQANLRSQCAIASDQPERFLQYVNQLFYENTADSAYATLFFAEYDDTCRRLRYANCGHLSALVLRCDNSLERLDSTCTVVGLFKDWDCCIDERLLAPGDIVALYTDGITESFNATGDEFGEQRLIEALRRYREQPSKCLLTSIVDDLHQFSSEEQHDDITLLVAKCGAS